MLGVVNGKTVKLLVDTRANVSVVAKKCITENSLQPPRYKLSGVGGKLIRSLDHTRKVFHRGYTVYGRFGSRT